MNQLTRITNLTRDEIVFEYVRDQHYFRESVRSLVNKFPKQIKVIGDTLLEIGDPEALTAFIQTLGYCSRDIEHYLVDNFPAQFWNAMRTIQFSSQPRQYNQFGLNYENMIGKTLRSVENWDNEILAFATEDRQEFFIFYHSQDCCECVTIDDICGDLQDLIGSPIVEAEEVSSEDMGWNETRIESDWDSETWTFYKFRTAKGSVTVRSVDTWHVRKIND